MVKYSLPIHALLHRGSLQANVVYATQRRRNEYSIDDMNNAIAGNDIRDDDTCIVDLNSHVRDRNCDGISTESVNITIWKCGAMRVGRHNVILDHPGELAYILREKQIFKGSRRKS